MTLPRVANALARIPMWTGLTLSALILLLALALVASADPPDISAPPSSDWHFDEGGTTLIKNKVWTVRHNITVGGGSVLKLEDCTFTFETPEAGLVHINATMGTRLELKGCSFSSGGRRGYYIEAHGAVVLTDCRFVGLDTNPAGHGGICVYGSNADLSFVKVEGNRGPAGLYLENCQLDMSNCEICNIHGDAMVVVVRNTTAGDRYDVSILDSDLWNTTRHGIRVEVDQNHATVALDLYNVEVLNVGGCGLVVDQGEHSQVDGGTGSVGLHMDYMSIHHAARTGVSISSRHQVRGGPNQNGFTVSIENSSVSDASENGIAVRLLYTHVDFEMLLKGSSITDIQRFSFDPTLGGLYWGWGGSAHLCTGGANLTAINCKFKRCAPTAFYNWDQGGSHILFRDCLFSEMGDDCILDMVEESGGQSRMQIEGCRFADNLGHCIRAHFQGSSKPRIQGGMVDVVNCTFEGNRGSDISMHAQGPLSGGGAGFNISGCKFEVCDGWAIDMANSQTTGVAYLRVNGSMFNMTRGIRTESGSLVSSMTDIVITNTSISNSSETALLVRGHHPGNVDVRVDLTNVTIDGAGRKGLWVRLGESGVLDTGPMGATVRADGLVVRRALQFGVLLETVPPDLRGVQGLELRNVTLETVHHGMMTVGFNGEVYNATTANTLRYHAVVMAGRVDLHSCEYDRIDEGRFIAGEGGVINFYYELFVEVVWSSGQPAFGANFRIVTNSGIVILSQSIIWPYGWRFTLYLNPIFVRETGIFSHNPYVLNATFRTISRTVAVVVDSDMAVRLELVDPREPEIEILYPKEGHMQQSTILSVGGAAWDRESGVGEVAVSIDGRTWVPAQGRLRWNATLEVNGTLLGRYSGWFNLRARVRDHAGNERVVFRLVRVDPVPPGLTLVSPEDGHVTSEPTVTVLGLCDADSWVEVNGEEVPVVDTMFSWPVALREGLNQITVMAFDPLGNVRTQGLTVHMDTRQPYVVLLSPREDTSVKEPRVPIEALLEERLRVVVNGVHVPFGSQWYPEGVGTLTYELGLAPQDELLRFEAWDPAGNKVTILREVSYDPEAPWIRLHSPGDQQVLGGPIVPVVGTMEAGARLYIDGEPITATEGFFEWWVVGVEGRNTLSLRAVDAAGNAASVEVEYWVDTAPPRLVELLPGEERSMVRRPVGGPHSFTIEGEVDMAFEAASGARSPPSLTVNGMSSSRVEASSGEVMVFDLVVSPSGAFSVPVQLYEGTNGFILELTDGAGNAATFHRTISLDSRPPVLVVRLRGVEMDEQGLLTAGGTSFTVEGHTDAGAEVTVNGIHVPIDGDGDFLIAVDMASDVTMVEVVSTDGAGNTRTFAGAVTQRIPPPAAEGDDDGGYAFLTAGALILLGSAVISFIYVRTVRDRWVGRGRS